MPAMAAYAAAAARAAEMPMLATPMVISKYVSTDGESQKLNVLYALAEGPIQTIASIKINDNAVANYTDVTIVTRPGDNSGVNQTWIPGFERTTSEKVIGQVLENNDYRTNATDGNAVTTLASLVQSTQADGIICEQIAAPEEQAEVEQLRQGHAQCEARSARLETRIDELLDRLSEPG
jgi:hypothetical protein